MTHTGTALIDPYKIFEKIRRVIPNASLHPTLMLLIKQNKLTREKLESGLWGYKKKSEDE